MEQPEEVQESESGPIVSEETQDETLVDAEQVESPELETEETDQEKIESKEPARDKRIAGYYTERSRATQLEQQNAELTQKLNQQQQPAAKALNEDDFDTDAEYYAAVAEQKVDQKIEAFRQEQSQAGVKNDRVVAQAGFAKEVAASKIADYDEKAMLLAESVGLRPDTLEALWKLKDGKGPKMVVYLADHLEVADDISPFELGELSAKMSATKPAQQTKASDPIKPTKPGGAIRKKLSDLSAEQIIDGDLTAYGINDR